MKFSTGIVKGVFFLLLFPLSGIAQDSLVSEKPNFMFQMWGHEHGLPASSIYAAASSNKGYLWFATGEGLVRFDGDQFTVFNAANTPEISYKIFRSLTEGNDGNLWTANRNELVKIKNGRFSTFSFPEEFQSHQIFAIDQDKDGTVWVGSNGDGVISFKDGSFSTYTTDEGLPDNQVTDIYVSDDGRVWFSTPSGIGYFLNGTPYVLDHHSELADINARQLLFDSQERLWIGTAENGVYRLDFEQDELVNFSDDQGLRGNMINSLIETRDGIIWTGTLGDGLYRIDGDTIHHYNSRDGLASNMIFSLYQSPDDIIWIGTAGAGLTKIRESKVQSLTSDDGLSSNIILPIYQEQNEDVWIGTGGEGLNHISNGNITHYTEDDGLSNNLIYSIYGQEDGTVWVGTSNGLNRIQGTNIETFYSADGLPNNMVHAITEDSNGLLWIAYSGGGLQVYSDGEFSDIEIPASYSGATLSSLFEDSRGDMWVGSHGSGAMRITEDSIYTYNEKNDFPNDIVLDFYEDNNGIIWIGTRDGFVRFENEEFEVFDTESGLEYSDFFRIMKDSNNTFWTCSNWGVQFFSKDDVEDYRDGVIGSIPAFQLTPNDGLPSRECNGGISPAGWQMQDGEIWFPTVAGVAMFNPEEIDYDTETPNVLIENLISGDETYQGDEEPVLVAGTRNFEIKYTALEFKNPDRVRFRYRLQNFDDEWIDADGRRTAYYTGLRPGNYEFEVQAAKLGGEWSSNPATIAFSIEPYFYQTRTFLFLSLLLLFFAGIAAQRFWRIKGDQKELQKLVDIRTKELTEEISQHKKTEKDLEKSLDEKTVLLKEIHHRVKNNLAIISALFQLQMYKTENEEAINLLSDSQNRIKSIAMIHEMLYQNELFSSIEMSDYTKNLVKNIQETLFQSSTVNVEYEMETIQLGINQAIPCGLMINEMITNSFKHAFPGDKTGTITISMNWNKEDGKIIMMVSDDGVGMDEDFESSESTGMELLRTLSIQLKGDIQVEKDDGVTFTVVFQKQSLSSPYHSEI